MRRIIVFKTISIDEKSQCVQLTFNRIEKNNAIDSQLLNEMNLILDSLNPTKTAILLLRGNTEFFCSGLDLQEVADYRSKEQFQEWAALFTKTLRRLTECPIFIASVIEGKVLAGGMGFIGASDYLISTENGTFKLTEALWGLIPAMIAPYLLRKISFHQMKSMALTCRSIDARGAKEIQLIDEVNNDLDKAIAQLIFRISRIDRSAIQNIKQFFNAIAPVSPSLEQFTMSEFVKHVSSEETLSRIKRYLDEQSPK